VLASCGEDRRLGFLDGNGKVAHIIRKAHPSSINRCKFINDHILVSGDDDGVMKVWDLRTVVPVFQVEDQREAITGIAFDMNISEFQMYLSCLNGTVAAYDLRQSSSSNSKLLFLSDSVNEELTGI
jgi:WD40 repeat protein